MEIVVVLAITASVIGLVGRLPDPRKVKRELGTARIEAIGSLVEGRAAAVRGTVDVTEDGALVTAPLTKRRCVYWLVVFDEVGVGGDFREVGRTSATVPFLLRSATGTARVVADNPRVALPGESFSRPVAHFSTRDDAFAELARRVCKPPNYPTSWLRGTEYVLEPGAFVTVRGWCTREPDPEASESVSGYREQLPTRPVLSGSRRTKLLIG